MLRFLGVRKGLAIAAGVVALVAGQAAGAYANTNPQFNSTYDLSAQLFGATHFTVVGNGTVTVTLTGTYGPSETLNVTIEEQTCGFFGCNWDGVTVGGTCSRVMYVGRVATCYFQAVVNNVLHRLDMTKATDGQEIKGTVQVR
ncbi:MAG: hypothetical protein WCJ42_08720 [Actinomycetes bacterium]